MKSRVFCRHQSLPSVRLFVASAAGLLVALAPSGLLADVKLPAIFGDHMVLQREASVPIWGWASPGEAVTVVAGGQKATATTGPDGKWTVKLSKLVASPTPIEVTITGKNSITLHDVLVGDVWVCSGQSNMEFGIKAFMPKEEFEKAGDPQIRLFMVPKWVAPIPEDNIGTIPPNTLIGSWQVCTPETLSKTGEWSGFPGVGYFFGRETHKLTQQPVGLIGSAWGGTRINSWTSLEGLQTSPAMASFTSGAVKLRDTYEEVKHTWETVTAPQWKAELAKWNEENKAAVEQYKVDSHSFPQRVKDAAAQNLPPPPKPVPPAQPKAPPDPIHSNQNSVALYNGMIAPLTRFGIKGVIWYQGEANADNPTFYRIALPLLINDWRKQWNQGDFPFLIVQLPNFMQRKPEPSESAWAGTREAQAKALTLPNTGLAVTIDIGEAGNIHPSDKWDVGYRLALAAQHVAYGRQDVTYSGPIYKASKTEGNKVRVTFDQTGGGLVIGKPPEHFFASQRNSVPPPSSSELEGFAIAGADHKFVWAKATIDGSSVVVMSDAVPQPVAVRYAWADNPACNLYNKEGLPAGPFRTDDFPFGK